MTLTDVPGAEADAPPADARPGGSRPDISLNRFMTAAIVGIALALPPYLGVLWGGRLDPLRSYYADHSFATFFETQARALFHGHWYVPRGSLGIEGFVVHGHEYTYFGPLPALLRMPILLVTSRLDGRLTAPSMLLAWLFTAVFVSLLLWRVRHVLRGAVPLGRAEAVAYGAVIAAVMSGSVLLYLGEMPAVYNEDLAWGVATAVAALFALLGVLERPSRRRIGLLGTMILAATLSRTPLGWACVIGSFMASAWFAFGYAGRDNRKWSRPVLAAGAVPLLVSMYVTWAKFGTPVGLPMASQVWAQIDQHRRDFLAANGGKAFSVRFIPTTLWTYLRPNGLRLTGVYPFVTLPAGPPRILGGAVFDQTYRTASVTASTPLLFVLAVWGIVTAFRPLPGRRPRVLRLLVLTAGMGTAGALMWGYIANRYLSDFIPVLCVGGAIGVVELFRRADSRPRSRAPGAVLAGVAVVLAIFSVVANLELSSTPTDPVAWYGARVQRYVQRQESLSNRMGDPISANVIHGHTLPAWAPADKLFVLGQCSALYISDGERYHTWIPVDFGPGLRHSFDVTVNQASDNSVVIPLVDIGSDVVSRVAIEESGGQLRAKLDDPLFPALGEWLTPERGVPFRVTVDADTQLHQVTVSIGGRTMLSTTISTGEQQIAVPPAPTGSPLAVAADPVAEPALCRNLPS